MIELLASAIDLAPMANPNDQDRNLLVDHCVDDSVDAYPKSAKP